MGLDDPRVFLEAIPEQLLESFLRRSATVPSERVRRACGDYFQRWVAALGPSDLSNGPTVEQLRMLAETDPEAYLPRVRRLILEASHEELKQSDGTTLASGWLPRRALVWLAEQFALFTEFFPDSEDILFHLALAEPEPHIGNNATAIWKQLFRIMLSGTPVSFESRLAILKSRLGSEVSEVQMLVLDALDHTLDRQQNRTLPASVIAGRIPPSEWIPKTRGEERKCFVAIVHLLVELTESKNVDLADRARAILGKRTRQLLSRGLLDSLACALTPAHTADATMVLVLDGVESFLHYDSEGLGTVEAQRYLDDVRNWRDKLVGFSFHLLLVSRTAPILGALVDVTARVGKANCKSWLRTCWKCQKIGSGKETGCMEMRRNGLEIWGRRSVHWTVAKAIGKKCSERHWVPRTVHSPEATCRRC